MPPLIFPYSFHKGRSLPIIPVGIGSTPQNWWKINAYVDSGAFYSLFDHSVAELLNIEVTKGKRNTAVVGDGDTITFYHHNIFLQLGDLQFSMPVGFSKDLKIGFNILGLDLFQRFKITFDQRKKVLVMVAYE